MVITGGGEGSYAGRTPCDSISLAHDLGSRRPVRRAGANRAQRRAALPHCRAGHLARHPGALPVWPAVCSGVPSGAVRTVAWHACTAAVLGSLLRLDRAGRSLPDRRHRRPAAGHERAQLRRGRHPVQNRGAAGGPVCHPLPARAAHPAVPAGHGAGHRGRADPVTARQRQPHVLVGLGQPVRPVRPAVWRLFRHRHGGFSRCRAGAAGAHTVVVGCLGRVVGADPAVHRPGHLGGAAQPRWDPTTV